jgi:hypothetical protein
LISVTPGKSSEKEKKFEETFSIMNSEGYFLTFENAVKVCMSEKVILLKGNRAIAISQDSVLFMENEETEVTKTKHGIYDAITTIGPKKILGWLYNG